MFTDQERAAGWRRAGRPGASNQAIAAKLALSLASVKKHASIVLGIELA
jgi:hypothetical protein